MKKSIHFGLFAVLGVVLIFTGCASKKQTTKQINALQAQVGTITDELTRLDQSLQETRSSIQAEQNRVNELESQLRYSKGRLSSLREEESVIQGIYRTPSGFQLPSLHIQQALKNAGYYQGTLDGKIGSQTRQAIRAFQRDNGLGADGIVGRQTWAKLKSYLER
jgi:outer membrane murein-binding lipoprotein Lpp